MHFKAVLFFIIVATISSSGISQEDSLALREGAKSAQLFLIGGLSAAYKNQLSPSTALRYRIDLSLSFNHDSHDGMNTSSYNSLTTQRPTTYSTDANGQNIAVSAQYLWYLGAVSIANVFIGIGPQVQYSRSFNKTHYESTIMLPLPAITTTDDGLFSSHSFGVGVTGGAGVECFVSRNVSIIGQYEAYFSYNWGKTKSNSSSMTTGNPTPSVTNNEADTKFWQVGLSSVKLGVAVYL